MNHDSQHIKDLKKLITVDFARFISIVQLIVDKNPKFQNDFFLLESQYNEIERKYDLNLISFDDYDRKLAVLKNSFLNLLDRLDFNTVDKHVIVTGLLGNQLLKPSVRVTSRKPLEALLPKYAVAKQRIYILQTWLEENDPIPRQLAKAVQNGIDLRILILEPNSLFATQRTDNLGFGSVRPDRPNYLYRILLNTIKKRLKANSSFSLKLYNNLPPFALYVIDDWMSVGLYWPKEGSLKNYHFEIPNANTDIGELFLTSFEALWNEAKEVSKSSIFHAD
ncbi:MAG: DUF5919 domain-containing protein [Cyanobacteria bacterium J06649_11]